MGRDPVGGHEVNFWGNTNWRAVFPSENVKQAAQKSEGWAGELH